MLVRRILVIFGAENLVDIFQVFWFVSAYYWSFCDPTPEAHEKAVQTAAVWWKKSPLCLPLFEGPWKSILTGHLQQEEDLLLPSSVQTESELF